MGNDNSVEINQDLTITTVSGQKIINRTQKNKFAGKTSGVLKSLDKATEQSSKDLNISLRNVKQIHFQSASNIKDCDDDSADDGFVDEQNRTRNMPSGRAAV